MNGPIWIYREQRSGSTWLTSFLVRTLNRRHMFVDYYEDLLPVWTPHENHSSYIFSSHLIENIEPVKMYDNARLLRTTRRDFFEQLLSLVFFRTYKNLTHTAANIWNEEDRIKFESVTRNKYSLTETDIIRWLKEKRDLDREWSRFSADLPHQTLYYEDFEEGVLLEGTNIFIKFDELSTQKLPDYKRSVFSNYDEIRYWFDLHKDIISS